MADLKTGFTAAMDELQAELAEDIEAMDLGAEAAESGRATIQGFIDAANDMLPRVRTAYADLAAAAQNALSVSGGNASVPGYAAGTRSAEEGFALVGENGPELVYFNGGEQVMTAEETAERDKLRRIYIDSVKANLTGQLDNTYILRPDGSKTKLQKKS